MKIYGLEKLSMVDFDGHLCATIFTSGCNFRCPYCHNSDLVLGTNLVEISEIDVFDYLKKRKNILDSVCVSGGEPTLQKDLPLFIKKLKDLGLLVKLDTNGTNFEILKGLVEQKLIDYVAMDIKSDKNGYINSFRCSNEALKNVEESVKLLKSNVIPYEFRTTVTAQLFSKEIAQNIAEWLKGARVLYLQCFKENETNLEKDLSKISQENLEEYKQILEKTIKEVKYRGY